MKPNRERLKTRLAVRHMRSIRRAIRDSVDVDSIVTAWFQLHHPDSNGTTVTPDAARTWARINVRPNTLILNEALARIYADAYVLGEDITSYEIARLVLKKAKKDKKQLASALLINWALWKPGNRAAAELLKPPQGLQRLLDSRNITIQEVSNTTIKRIGSILASALEEGKTPRQVSILIDQLIDDPVRALTIAQTEMSSAVVQASLDTYRDSGVEMVEWLVADPCDECQQNLDQSPIDINEQWINGDPPVHPNCMCDIAPYVVDTQGLFNR